MCIRDSGYEKRTNTRFDYLEDRIESLCYSDDSAGEFTWKSISKTLVYSANRIPEIADNIYSIDRSMRWGFGWDRGPFEVWDIIGLERSVERMKEESIKVPTWVQEMLSNGKKDFYTYLDGVKHYYCPDKKDYEAVPVSAKNMKFFNLKKNNGLIKKNWSASVVDLGDGITGVELHSVLKEDLNPIDGSIMETFKFARDWTEENGYKGLVISGDGKNFSAGANLNMIPVLLGSIKISWNLALNGRMSAFSKENKAINIYGWGISYKPGKEDKISPWVFRANSGIYRSFNMIRSSSFSLSLSRDIYLKNFDILLGFSSNNVKGINYQDSQNIVSQNFKYNFNTIIFGTTVDFMGIKILPRINYNSNNYLSTCIN